VLALERLHAIRIAATPASLDAMTPPRKALVLRTATDEALLIGSAPIAPVTVDDEHAIIFDDTSWFGMWVDLQTAMRFLKRACEFDLPTERPALVQGMIAHLAIKLWLENDRVLFVVPSAVAEDFKERFERLMKAPNS